MRLILIGILLYAGALQAATQSIIGKNASKGTVFVIGNPGEFEALRFYESLSAPEQVVGDKRFKKFAFDAADGSRLLRATCAFSRMTPEHGTCTLTLYPNAGVTLDQGSGLISYITPTPEDAARLAQGFTLTTPDVFVSNDGRFRVTAEMTDGQVRSFSLVYR